MSAHGISQSQPPHSADGAHDGSDGAEASGDVAPSSIPVHDQTATNDRDAHHSHDHTHAAEHPIGAPPNSRFRWNVHHPVDGIDNRAAVEVGPWSGLLPRWRIVIPADFKSVVRWGVGAAGSLLIDADAIRRPVSDDAVQLHDGPEVSWMGGHNPLSKSLSAYLVFDGDPPHWVAFGQADAQDGPPTSMEGIYFNTHPHPHPAHDHEHDHSDHAPGHQH